MKLKFWKMSAAGNDFIFIYQNEKFSSNFKRKLAIKLCERKISIGADGIIFVKKIDKNSLKVEYLNSDGTKAFCGNGTRCAALWFYLNIKKLKTINLYTIKGILKAEIKNKNRILLQMPEIKQIDLNCKGKFPKWVKEIHFIDTGTRHSVIPLKEIEKLDIISMGREIRYNPYFLPKGTNVNFIRFKKNDVYIRTYEKGVEDETLSCGTGITAAGIISAILYNKKSPIRIISKNGDKFYLWFKIENKKIKEVFLEGPAQMVFSGEIEI